MNEPDHAPIAVRRRRLLYRATHRGTHETDLLVGGFVGPRIAGMSGPELDALEVILELPDVDLADWLTGRRPLPDEQGAAELDSLVLILLRRMKDAAGP